MQMGISNFFYTLTILTGLCSVAYLIFALFALELFNRSRKQDGKQDDFLPAVTILKPVYGLDPEMAENLKSFCQQDYPDYQIVFAIQDKNDPAIPVVKEIMTEFKGLDISYVIDPCIYGTNHKVSNLINAYPKAKHDYLLIADSDMRVPRHYLSNVVAPFVDEKVGAVTCLYSGSARGKSFQGKLASSLNAMFINEWFLPSVLISRLLRPIKYCLGATMIIHRDLLNKIGGFKSLSDYLADDYMLGKLVAEQGYKVHLSNFMVENIVEETSIKELITHELRWARTLRRVEPIGYACTFLTDTAVISSLAAFTVYMATQSLLWSVLPLSLIFIARILLHKRSRTITQSDATGSVWLIPIRDLLSFFIRIISFTGNSIQWRDNVFCVDSDGLIHAGQKLPDELDADEKNRDLATTQDY